MIFFIGDSPPPPFFWTFSSKFITKIYYLKYIKICNGTFWTGNHPAPPPWTFPKKSFMFEVWHIPYFALNLTSREQSWRKSWCSTPQGNGGGLDATTQYLQDPSGDTVLCRNWKHHGFQTKHHCFHLHHHCCLHIIPKAQYGTNVACAAIKLQTMEGAKKQKMRFLRSGWSYHDRFLFLAVQTRDLVTPSLSDWATFWFWNNRVTLETCDLWDIWSEWWRNMAWPKNTYLLTYPPPTYLPTYLPPLQNTLKEQS